MIILLLTAHNMDPSRKIATDASRTFRRPKISLSFPCNGCQIVSICVSKKLSFGLPSFQTFWVTWEEKHVTCRASNDSMYAYFLYVSYASYSRLQKFIRRLTVAIHDPNSSAWKSDAICGIAVETMVLCLTVSIYQPCLYVNSFRSLTCPAQQETSRWQF